MAPRQAAAPPAQKAPVAAAPPPAAVAPASAPSQGPGMYITYK